MNTSPVDRNSPDRNTQLADNKRGRMGSKPGRVGSNKDSIRDVRTKTRGRKLPARARQRHQGRSHRYPIHLHLRAAASSRGSSLGGSRITLASASSGCSSKGPAGLGKTREAIEWAVAYQSGRPTRTELVCRSATSTRPSLRRYLRAVLDTLEPLPNTALLSTQEAKGRLRDTLPALRRTVCFPQQISPGHGADTRRQISGPRRRRDRIVLRVGRGRGRHSHEHLHDPHGMPMHKSIGRAAAAGVVVSLPARPRRRIRVGRFRADAARQYRPCRLGIGRACAGGGGMVWGAPRATRCRRQSEPHHGRCLTRDRCRHAAFQCDRAMMGHGHSGPAGLHREGERKLYQRPSERGEGLASRPRSLAPGVSLSVWPSVCWPELMPSRFDR